MQFKDTLLLMTALTAGSAVARLHGHDRRHAHAKIEEPEAPAVTAAPQVVPELKERAVGDVVYDTIDGVLVSWINEWAVEVSVSSSAFTTSTVIPTSTAAAAVVATASPSGIESTIVPVPTSSTSGGSWYETPSDGSYSREGFGGSTSSKTVGSLDWDYVGNVGSPWGSNIIEVSEANANQYKHVIRFEGSSTDEWSLVFWNTYGPDGKMTGFFHPNQALSFTIGANEVKYVAIDDNSQGGWAAAKGEVPVSGVGQYAGIWGEFDMSNAKNDAHSGWDVSSIIAQLAGLEIHGMRICNHLGESCSTIGNGLTNILNAYTAADQGNPSLACQQNPGPVRLVVNLDYA